MLRENLPVDSTLKRLIGLQNHDFVEDYLSDPAQCERVLTFALEGWNQLITRFNWLSDGAEELKLPFMQSSTALKRTLGAIKLANLTEFSSRTYLAGLSDARSAFINGQEAKKGFPPIRGDIVKTPSMSTHPQALVVGTIGHLYERTVFAWLRHQGIVNLGGQAERARPFTTDDILHPLSECAMLLSIEAALGRQYDSTLLPLFIRPNSEDESGGLGWVDRDRVRESQRDYAKSELARMLRWYSDQSHTLDEILESFMKQHKLSSKQWAVIAYARFYHWQVDEFRSGILAQMAYGL